MASAAGTRLGAYEIVSAQVAEVPESLAPARGLFSASG
jgi:hypothetical protein